MNIFHVYNRMGALCFSQGGRMGYPAWNVEVKDWPARSLDKNPIEHVWDQMGVWIGDMDAPQALSV